MKKKFIDVKTGKEIQVGQVVDGTFKTPYGIVTIPVALAGNTLSMAIRDGLIRVVVIDDETHTDIMFYIEHLAKRIGWSAINLDKYLNNLSKVSITSVFEILLREVAIVLDKKYPDHIEKSENIFCVDRLTGKIVKIKDVKSIKNFRNFAAFRTIEDAQAAVHILSPILKIMFEKGGRKQEDC